VSARTLEQLARHRVAELKSVSPPKVAGLASMGIETVLDLLTHYPRRYVDRTNLASVASLAEGEEAVVTGRVLSTSTRRLRGGRSTAEIVLHDGSARLTCTFFNQAWRARQVNEGDEVTVYGKVRLYRSARQMANPVIDLVGDQTGRIVPIYPQSGKANVSSAELAKYTAEALERAKEFADPVPAEFLRQLRLVGRTEAFRAIHAPTDLGERARARTRLAFDELLRLQLLLVKRKRDFANLATGIAHDTSDGGLVSSFIEQLPFELTGAQRIAVETIARDLALAHPMHRLLQGDVGAGKTVVALATLLYGIQSGHQGAFMVPTEVLAEQHHLSARRLLRDLSVADPSRLGGERPLMEVLLTSRTSGAERSHILGDLATGKIDLVVGTHALLTDDVAFCSLGVVVVDEQHRFGVEQRAALREKAAVDPDLLVMTATPIPRTAAMTVYGDLDHTTLDELPPGRTPVATTWIGFERSKAAWEHVAAELRAGHQAYVVCPLVGGGAAEEEGFDDAGADEGTDKPGDRGDIDIDDDGGVEAADGCIPAVLDALGDEAVERPPPRSAIEERDRLAAEELAGWRVGLLHGQLPSKEKDAVMDQFRHGRIDVLVATTVVEVGVDVVNATVMVIEDADRFGIAQLHQLRGRVGRGKEPSSCFLIADPVTDLAQKRLEAVVRTPNGFELAEADLDLRGGGTVLGARQKGRTDLKLASLRRDRDLVEKAREVAAAILERDPGLTEPSNRLLFEEAELFVSEEERPFLFRG
jgi:ATP-dependent DNA helicase RecG